MHKGVHLDPTIFKYFPVRISIWNLHHICIHQNNHKSAKRTLKNVAFHNGGQKIYFSFRENSHVTKNVKKKQNKTKQNKTKQNKKQTKNKKTKKTFPMEFFNEIWLKVGEHEYIYIFEIKFEKNYSV